MIDIHNHLLFGVDDGSRSLEESLEMVRQFKMAGYQGAVVTPHYYEGVYTSEKAENQKRLEDLRTALRDAGIAFELYLGNEIYYSPRLAQWLKENRVASMNETPYLLIEFPLQEDPLHLSQWVYQLQMEGYTPIFAHVERYSFVQKRPQVLEEYLNKGCLMQMNLSSVLSEGQTGKTLRYLLSRKMVQIAASDAHQSEWRAPSYLPKALETLRTMVEPDYFEALAWDNPRKILENRVVSVEIVKNDKSERVRKKSLICRLFKGGWH